MTHRGLHGMISVTLPIKTVNTSNVREHWAARAKRAKAHRGAAAMFVRRQWPPMGPESLLDLGFVVTMTRVAPRELDDDGNVTSLKAVRDGVADALGLKSDRDPRVTWEYAQAKGKVREYAVVIEIKERP